MMLSADRHQARQSIIAGLGIALGVALVVGLQLPQLPQLQGHSQNDSIAAIHRDTAAQQARLSLLQQMPSFGFNNLIADWVFLNFLQYFGDESAREQTDYRLSPQFFKVILEQNPYFIPAYTFLSTSTALYAGMPEQSVPIMEKGLQSLQPNVPPWSYFAWRQLGIDQLLFLGNAPAAQRSFEIAANWAQTSSEPGSKTVAAVSRQTAAFLANNPNSKTAQVAAWTMVLGNAPDDQTRQVAIQRIQTLGGKIVANPDGSFRVLPPAQD